MPFSSKFRNVMSKLTVPDNFMKTVLPVKFMYISNWYDFIVILIEFIWVKPFKGKWVSRWKNVIYRCRHWTTEFVTAFEPVGLMLFATCYTS